MMLSCSAYSWDLAPNKVILYGLIMVYSGNYKHFTLMNMHYTPPLDVCNSMYAQLVLIGAWKRKVILWIHYDMLILHFSC